MGESNSGMNLDLNEANATLGAAKKLLQGHINLLGILRENVLVSNDDDKDLFLSNIDESLRDLQVVYRQVELFLDKKCKNAEIDKLWVIRKQEMMESVNHISLKSCEISRRVMQVFFIA